jgi:two-component system response regulator ResD
MLDEVGQQVLVVDDDPTVGEVLLGYLRRAGFEPQLATDGEAALEIAARTEPDLVVLDVMLPGLDGLAVYRELIRTRPVPVIMLTALGSEHDRVLGLELGADDYVTKPFSPRELVLRIQSVLRRTRQNPDRPTTGVLNGGDLRVDLAGHRVSRAGTELALTAREFDLLMFFLALARLLLADFDLGVVEIAAQPFRIEGQRDRRPRAHVPTQRARWLPSVIEWSRTAMSSR